MARRMSYPVLVALGLGVALQLAFAFGPDPGIGPTASGLGEIDPSLSSVVDVAARNLLVAALVAAGALVTAMTVLGRRAGRPRLRLLVYLGLLAVAYWAYFVSGVSWLAADLELSRPALAARLVHGLLEWPALLLPWAGVAFAITAGRRIDLRVVGVACACSLPLLVGAALLESLVVPGLLGSAT